MQRGYFTRDPRSRANEWRVLLRPLVGETNLEPDQSPIGEVRAPRLCGTCVCRGALAHWRGGGAAALLSPAGSAAGPCPALPCPVHPPLQLFNVAWARHEIISETTDACLTWLETGGKKGVPLEWVSVP